MLTEGRGSPQYTQLYVTNRSIKMLPLFPLYLCLSHSFSLSISLSLIHICSAANPSNAVSPCLLSLHPRHLPSPRSLSPSLSLSLSRCTGDVILFQLDSPPFSLLPPPSLSLSPPFPISGWLSTAQHPIHGSFSPRVGGGGGMPA